MYVYILQDSDKVLFYNLSMASRQYRQVKRIWKKT